MASSAELPRHSQVADQLIKRATDCGYDVRHIRRLVNGKQAMDVLIWKDHRLLAQAHFRVLGSQPGLSYDSTRSLVSAWSNLHFLKPNATLGNIYSRLELPYGQRP